MRRRLVQVLLGSAAVVVVLVLAAVVYDATRADRIAPGIRAGGVYVGGLDVGQARDRLARELSAGVRRRVVVTYRSARYVLRPGLVRARLDPGA
ncbi:MAG: hypothetical protein M3296_05940, partial [Actinomycetota bacterium]|nr:hypothetical protein [Actinomycetota bacterium]